MTRLRPRGARPNLLLDPLPRPVRERLLARGRRAHFAAGREIFATGTEGTTALLIETGRVRVKLTSTDGRRSVLSHLGPGEVVGELAVLDGNLRSADAEAAVDVTGTLLGRDALLDVLRDHPDAALGLISALCGRLRSTNEAYGAQVMSSGAERLARVLLRLFETWGVERDGVTVLVDEFSQGELGDMAGLTRESTNRMLRRFETEGLVRRDGKVLHLLDADGLAGLAFDHERWTTN